jgi:lysophospholipase L1-like esterase
MKAHNRLIRRILSLAAAVLSGTSLPAEASRNSSGRETVAPATSLDLPATNIGLPGDGPIRRYDWFEKLWKERRESFARNADKDRGAVVFLGDSITQGWGDDVGGSFPGLKVANRGISGDTTRGVLIRLNDDVVRLQPKGVVLLIGTNDLEERAQPKTAVANIELILKQLTQYDPKMPVLVCEVFPSSAKQTRPASEIKELNKRLAEVVAKFPQAALVSTWAVFANDFGDAKPEEFPDLLHPNEQGYAKWAAALKPVLKQHGLLP